MKEDTRWKLQAGLVLLTLSLALYIVHFSIFQDRHHLLIFLVGDLAFVPFEVFIVTLLIDQMLESRERRKRMEKLNMVIGTFFSHLGTPLLAAIACSDPDIPALRADISRVVAGNEHGVTTVKNTLLAHRCSVSISKIDLVALRDLLEKNEDFILRIVENPMVFEHESFTDLILAVTHLDEELRARDSLTSLPATDLAHLQGDINRAYLRLVPEWVRYMDYLQKHYPYLYSLALRKNPFDENASVIVRS